MSIRNFDAIFEPKTILVIGSGVGAKSIASVVEANLARSGFPGTIASIDNQEGSVDRISVTPDLAIIAQPPSVLPSLIERLGARGCRAAMLIDIGHDLQDWKPWLQKALTVARPHLMRLVGPDSLGVICPHTHLNASCAHVMPHAGSMALVSESGSIASAIIDWASQLKIGFSRIVSLGGMADVDIGDMLEFLASDFGTRSIILYVENVTHAKKFMSAARVAARSKPVIVIRPRDALKGVNPIHPDQVYDAAFRRAGLLRVLDLPELLEAAATLASGRRVSGNRLTILGNSGAAGRLAQNAMERYSARPATLSPQTIGALRREIASEAPTGPVDLRHDATGRDYRATLEALLTERHSDAILAIHTPNAFSDQIEIAEAVIDTAAKHLGPPLLTTWLGNSVNARALFGAHNIPSFDTPDEAVRAFAHLSQYKRNQDLLLQTPSAGHVLKAAKATRAIELIERVRSEGRRELEVQEAADLLNLFDVSASASGEGLSTKVRVGVICDPTFGPIVVLAKGEWAVDSGPYVGLPPLNSVLARELIDRSGIAQQIPVSQPVLKELTAALENVLLSMSELLIRIPGLELVADLVLVSGKHLVALPVTAILPRNDIPAPELVIRPYPYELEHQIVLRHGETFVCRPIRPEDEAQLIEMAKHCTREDIRLRFFRSIKDFSHEMASRLSQIDYDREMALIATDADSVYGAGAIYGIVRLGVDPGADAAEFAVLVRSDMKGRGLGYQLMQEILTYARRRGIARVYGDVLHENTTMRHMAHELGFHTEPIQPGSDTSHVSIDLA
jgi:acetyltransferase